MVAPGSLDRAVSIGDGRDPDAAFYAIPRRTEIILGGCALVWPADAPLVADPAITDRILGHAARLGLVPGAQLEVRVALRPFRPTVRLERDAVTPRLIHCYGHGGAGFTLAHGCAAEVAALVAAAPARASY